MRLTPAQINTSKSTAIAVLGEGAQVTLFGSRVNHGQTAWCSFMSVQRNNREPHCTFGVNMFLHTTHVQALPDYRLHVVFNNGLSGEVSLLNELWGEVFEPLRNEQLFATARHDEEMGTVVWANGADFAPEFLMDLLQAQTQKAA